MNCEKLLLTKTFVSILKRLVINVLSFRNTEALWAQLLLIHHHVRRLIAAEHQITNRGNVITKFIQAEYNFKADK